jgi:hypothetical protein
VRSYFETPEKEYVAEIAVPYKQWELTPTLHGADIIVI